MPRLKSLLILVLLFAVHTDIAHAVQNPVQRDIVVANQPENDIQSTNAGIPRGYAVVIGVAKYKNLDSSMQLAFPESDAAEIYRVLISKEGGAFPAENVHLVTGREATLARIRSELEEWLPSRVKPEDRVVVYFAGHGFVKNGRGYLAPWDIDPNDPDSSAYSMGKLGDVLTNRIKARWKVLLTDACHSGKITDETTNEGVDTELKNLPGDFLKLTATTAREKSYEDPKLSTGFGLFTYFLAQGWRGEADGYDTGRCDGKITANELVEYVRASVKKYAAEHSVAQTPREGGDYDGEQMVLGYKPACLDSTPKGPQTGPVGAAILETNMDDVTIYMDGKLLGKVQKSAPLRLEAISSGFHTFEGVRDGYESDRKEIMVAPGQESVVKIRILYVKKIKKSALDKDDEGEKLLSSKQASLLSTVNPLNIAPTSRTQSEKDLKRAKELFTQALNEEPGFSVAAFHLGQVNQLLSDKEASLKAYRRAIQIDPNYTDARVQSAALLIESGDPDGAIIELNTAVRLEPSNDEAYSMLARAFWDKSAWTNAVEMADKAIQLKPSNDQAHLWKADALRQLAAAEKKPAQQNVSPHQKALYEDARENYQTFLRLTNFSGPPLEWVAFHFVGFHAGRRHADRQDSWVSQRSAAFLGVCQSEEKLGNLLRAKEHCEKALKLDANDPIAQFIVGNVYRDLYNSTSRCEYLPHARESYQKMVSLSPDLEESKLARAYIKQIDAVLPDLPPRECR
jgi:tetratricopeptide (TPR) repeat protein